MERVMKLASKNSVMIFSNSSCCMYHSIKRFFIGLGVNRAIHELDEDPKGREMEKALGRLLPPNSPVPAVFIGGQLVGPTNTVMSLHLNGSLVPMLKAAGYLALINVCHVNL